MFIKRKTQLWHRFVTLLCIFCLLAWAKTDPIVVMASNAIANHTSRRLKKHHDGYHNRIAVKAEERMFQIRSIFKGDTIADLVKVEQDLFQSEPFKNWWANSIKKGRSVKDLAAELVEHIVGIAKHKFNDGNAEMDELKKSIIEVLTEKHGPKDPQDLNGLKDFFTNLGLNADTFEGQSFSILLKSFADYPKIRANDKAYYDTLFSMLSKIEQPLERIALHLLQERPKPGENTFAAKALSHLLVRWHNEGKGLNDIYELIVVMPLQNANYMERSLNFQWFEADAQRVHGPKCWRYKVLDVVLKRGKVGAFDPAENLNQAILPTTEQTLSKVYEYVHFYWNEYKLLQSDEAKQNFYELLDVIVANTITDTTNAYHMPVHVSKISKVITLFALDDSANIMTRTYEIQVFLDYMFTKWPEDALAMLDNWRKATLPPKTFDELISYDKWDSTTAQYLSKMKEYSLNSVKLIRY
ncbi:hypothetical protein CCR75_007324 [Bremia lactucae]|uniref:RxLR effector protein n=1 Tax=Bremia lactucae TaxID=4779 RepID=A0A976ID05_BRELC|nr:hypothetical protein CCR75_007324 [Bremia lactucae]